MIPIRDLIDNAVAAAVEGQADEAAEAVITAGELLEELAIALSRIEQLLIEAHAAHAPIVTVRGKKVHEAILVAQNAIAKVNQVATPPATPDETPCEVPQVENSGEIEPYRYAPLHTAWMKKPQ